MGSYIHIASGLHLFSEKARMLDTQAMHFSRRQRVSRINVVLRESTRGANSIQEILCLSKG